MRLSTLGITSFRGQWRCGNPSAKNAARVVLWCSDGALEWFQQTKLFQVSFTCTDTRQKWSSRSGRNCRTEACANIVRVEGTKVAAAMGQTNPLAPVFLTPEFDLFGKLLNSDQEHGRPFPLPVPWAVSVDENLCHAVISEITVLAQPRLVKATVWPLKNGIIRSGAVLTPHLPWSWALVTAPWHGTGRHL